MPSNPDNQAQHATEGVRPRILIIGAGLSGMATGAYLQMNGFDTHILERHSLPGGCCTAWSRNGYLFDYCIEWLLGSASGNDAHQVWRELGALDGKTIRNFPLFNRVVNEQGEEVNFYNDPDRLESHLLALSPEDATPIKSFCADLRRFGKVDIFPPLKPNPLMSWREKLSLLGKILPAFRLFWRTGATQMDAFAARFKHPLLKKSLAFIFFQDHECFPMLPYLYNMAQAQKGNAGFPQGGSLGLAKSIEQRYLALGGQISYGVKATKILVQDGRATGVQLKNKKCFYADYVVAACDGYTTLYEMLEGQYRSPTTDRLYEEMLHKPGILYPGVVSVFIGFKGSVGVDEPHSTTYLLSAEQAALLPGCQQNSLVLQHRDRFADGFAPPGHSLIHITYLSDFDQWNQLRSNDKPTYRAQKVQIGEFIAEFLERRYPGIKERIDVVEVATPVTQKRYTGNTKGSILAWKSFTQAEDLANNLINKYRMQLPGLSHFYMAGQWIGGGGLNRAAISGRYVAQFICKELQRPFNTSYSNNTQPWHFNNLKNKAEPSSHTSGDISFA
ncbi:MAG: NAD(P)/FAD-dependent oxidoreductase [Marinagarivorans sp.]